MKNPIEKRFAEVQHDDRTLRGTAIVYGQPTEISMLNRAGKVVTVTERIMPNAWSNRDDDIVALDNHDSSAVLGRTSAGTLRLRDDSAGLSVEIELLDTSRHNDILANVRAGNIKGMSFGFRVLDDEWRKTETGLERDVKSIQLVEVTTTAFPAYKQTSVRSEPIPETVDQVPEPKAKPSYDAALQLKKLTRPAK